MLEQVIAFSIAFVAIVILALMLLKRIHMRSYSYFDSIRAATNRDVNQLNQITRKPPKWLATLLFLFGAAVAASNIAIIGHAVDSGHLITNDMQYAEAVRPAQFWLYIGKLGVIASVATALSVWSLIMLLRNRSDFDRKEL